MAVAQSQPQPSSARMETIHGLGVALTAKYSQKPGFQANAALSAPLNLTIEKTDINILLGGTTSKMTYKIESDYLKNKAKTKAKKEIDKLIDNKLNLKEEQKSLIKGLFGK